MPLASIVVLGHGTVISHPSPEKPCVQKHWARMQIPRSEQPGDSSLAWSNQRPHTQESTCTGHAHKRRGGTT